MEWKEWPGWLKGGVIFSLIIIILIILCGLIVIPLIHYFNIPNYDYYPKCSGFTEGMRPHQSFMACFAIPIGIASLPVGLLLMRLPQITNDSFYLLIYFIISIIFWFLIGALIGFIIGKIKSRGENIK